MLYLKKMISIKLEIIRTGLYRFFCSLRDLIVFRINKTPNTPVEWLYKKGIKQYKDTKKTHSNVNKFYKAVENNDHELISQVINKELGVVDPLSFYTKQVYGPIYCKTTIKKYFDHHSKEFALDMLEIYCMYLLRDLKFSELNTNSKAIKYVELLKSLDPKHRHDLKANANFSNDTYYVSQFLLVPVKYWHSVLDNKIQPYKSGVDSLTTVDDYRKLHFDGKIPQLNVVDLNAPRRYPITGRDLAAVVHKDHPIQYPLNALKYLFVEHPTSRKSFDQTPGVIKFVDDGLPLIENLLTMASYNALRSAWYHKFYTSRVLRPEEFGYNVDQDVKGYNRNVLNKNNVIMKDVYSKINSYLLPGTYPEGSPTHPSYPAGHAVLAGAGATVIKAFFDENYKIPYYIPSENGLTLIEQPTKVKIGDELNKLMFNIAFGRNWAGIHYRSDGEAGIRFGEDIAMHVLSDYARSRCINFKFTRYDGEIVNI